MGMAPWRREVIEIVAFLTDCRCQLRERRDHLRNARVSHPAVLSISPALVCSLDRRAWSERERPFRGGRYGSGIITPICMIMDLRTR